MTTALLKKLRVKMMDWPSMFPDLNPIEHLWGILKWKEEERKVSNIHQLRDVIMEEWKRTPVATCEALVNSKRVKAELEYIGWPHKILTLWTQFRNFHLGVYSHLWSAVKTLMAVCRVILRGQQIYTVIQAVHSLLYIVAKCNFFSVVTWRVRV